MFFRQIFLESSIRRLVAPRKAAIIASSLLLTGGLTSCSEGQGDTTVYAEVKSPTGSIEALLPPTNEDGIKGVDLVNGTSVALECLTGENGKQYQANILSGKHKDVDRALLLTTEGLGLNIKSGVLSSLKFCL